MPFYIAKNLLICAVALLLTAASGSLAAAGNRIATVDLEKVFNSYYKTKIIDQDFTDQGKVYRNYIQRQAEQLRTMENKFRQKLLQSQNIALSPAERTKRANEVKQLESDLKRRRAELEQYAAERARILQESAAAERKKVLEEIRAEIRRRAAIEGYALVLDSSGKSMNDTSIVLYSIDALDITGKVITELNRGAGKNSDRKNDKQ